MGLHVKGHRAQGGGQELDPLQLQLFAQRRARPGCSHVLLGPWLKVTAEMMGNPNLTLNSRGKSRQMELSGPGPPAGPGASSSRAWCLLRPCSPAA